MFHYRACGLGIASDRPLNGLEPVSATRVDVSIRSRPLGPTAPSPHGFRVEDDPASSVTRVEYPDGTEFVLDPERGTIEMRWRPPLTEEDATCYLLGPILGLWYRRRGRVCLHAAAVAREGRAALLLGPKGSGKSTIAAALARRGWTTISDDWVPLIEDGPEVRAVPTFPRLRLRPDAAAVVGGGAELHRTAPTWPKLSLDLPTAGLDFASHPLPVAAVVTGRESEDAGPPDVEELGPGATLALLLESRYPSRDSPSRPGPVRAEVELLARLVERVVRRRVRFRRDLRELDAFCDVLEDELIRILAADRGVECTSSALTVG